MRMHDVLAGLPSQEITVSCFDRFHRGHAPPLMMCEASHLVLVQGLVTSMEVWCRGLIEQIASGELHAMVHIC